MWCLRAFLKIGKQCESIIENTPLEHSTCSEGRVMYAMSSVCTASTNDLCELTHIFVFLINLKLCPRSNFHATYHSADFSLFEKVMNRGMTRQCLLPNCSSQHDFYSDSSSRLRTGKKLGVGIS